jgi:hypothetical protein
MRLHDSDCSRLRPLVVISLSLICGLGLAALSAAAGAPRFEPPLPDGALRSLAWREGQDTILALAFSGDESLVAMSHHGEVCFWDLATGKRRTRSLPLRAVDSLALSGNGKTVVVDSASGEGTVAYDVASGKVLHRFLSADRAAKYPSRKGLAVSPDGKSLACSTAQDLRFFDLATNKEERPRRYVRDPDSPESVSLGPICFTADGKLLAAGTWVGGASLRQGQSAPVLLFNPDTGRCLQRIRANPRTSSIRACSLSADGRVLACIAVEERPDKFDPVRTEGVYLLRVWEVASGKEIFTQGPRGGEWAAAAPDGRHVIAPGRDGFVVWDVVVGKPAHAFQDPNNSPTSGQFLSDGKTFVTTNVLPDSCALYFWDVGAKMKLAKGPDLDRKALERLWAELTSDNAARARKALWGLAASPAQAVPFLTRQLRPVPAPDAATVDRLLADLDAKPFAKRQRAKAELEKLSWLAAPALHKAAEKPASTQQAKFVEELLEKLTLPHTSPERLRALRAVEALERIGTAEARKLLKEIADGAPGVPETEDARSSLQRLAKHDARKP